jgi:hypothetical protein
VPYRAVNTGLVSLYWQLGEHISQKIEKAEWGDGVVGELAATRARRYPGMRGRTSFGCASLTRPAVARKSHRW